MERKKVVIGMSGGVDSSVAAYLLKKQGYEVVGVTMHIWQEENSINGMNAEKDAKRMAEAIGIEHRVVHFEDEFRKKVVNYFIQEYLSGKTPNPCNVCNRYIKWECLLKAAGEIGADYVATGHYARIDKLENGRYAICNSITAKKDQTYALYNLTQEQLAHTIMPVGAYEKDDIRKIAKDIGLDVASKADSQDICFIPDGDYVKFIRNNSGVSVKEGNFVDKAGNILGKHKGITNYTIGQRKGLNLAMGHPVFVTGIDTENNTVIIGENEDLFTKKVTATDFNYMAVEHMEPGQRYVGKIRYAHKGDWCTVMEVSETEGTVTVEFDEPVRAITPGQSLVLYTDEYVAGGGTIAGVPTIDGGEQ